MEYFTYGNEDHYKQSSCSEETNSENKDTLQQTGDVISFNVHFYTESLLANTLSAYLTWQYTYS